MTKLLKNYAYLSLPQSPVWLFKPIALRQHHGRGGRSFLHQPPWWRVWIKKRLNTEESKRGQHRRYKRRDRISEKQQWVKKVTEKTACSTCPCSPWVKGKPKPPTQGKPSSCCNRLAKLAPGEYLCQPQILTPMCRDIVRYSFSPCATGQLQNRTTPLLSLPCWDTWLLKGLDLQQVEKLKGGWNRELEKPCLAAWGKSPKQSTKLLLQRTQIIWSSLKTGLLEECQFRKI